MAYYVERPPKANRIQDAWKHTENYLGTSLTQKLPALFIQCNSYSAWSFALAFQGIEGWPVAAMWDDLRQTCRDSMS